MTRPKAKLKKSYEQASARDNLKYKTAAEHHTYYCIATRSSIACALLGANKFSSAYASSRPSEIPPYLVVIDALGESMVREGPRFYKNRSRQSRGVSYKASIS